MSTKHLKTQPTNVQDERVRDICRLAEQGAYKLFKIFFIDLEMKDTDQHRKSRTGGDIEPYDEVVIRNGGIRNQGFYDKPVQSSADDNQAGRSKGGISGEIFLRKRWMTKKSIIYLLLICFSTFFCF